MRRHILTGAMGTIYGVLTTGMYLVAFGNAIGVSIQRWGILMNTAICSFAIAFQLISGSSGSSVLPWRPGISFRARARARARNRSRNRHRNRMAFLRTRFRSLGLIRLALYAAPFVTRVIALCHAVGSITITITSTKSITRRGAEHEHEHEHERRYRDAKEVR